MNSIDGVLARIQEILTRIHEIQAKDGRVQGMGPNAAAPAQQSFSAPRTTGGTSTSPSAAKNAQFQQLLNEALSAGTSPAASAGTGGLTSTQLGKLGNLGNLESILGATVNNGLGGAGSLLGSGGLGTAGLTGTGLGAAGGATPGPATASSLQQYRNELLQALQELAKQRQKHQSQ